MTEKRIVYVVVEIVSSWSEFEEVNILGVFEIRTDAIEMRDYYINKKDLTRHYIILENILNPEKNISWQT